MNRYIAFKVTLALLLLNALNWSSAAQENRADLLEKIRPAVVALIAYNDKGEVIECGTGFFISSEGRLLSCRHLLRHASSAEARTREGDVYPVRTVIADDQNLDLIELLVDLNGCKVPYLKVTDVNAAKDEQVTAFGHEHIVSGFVSYVRTYSEPQKNFLFSSVGQARATGGPVVNKKGEVIAIATEQAVGDQTETLGIASINALALVPGKTETLADWKARIEGKPEDSSEVLFFAGLNLALNDDYKRAIPLLIKAADRNPRDAESRFYVGYASARLRLYQEALVAYLEAIRIAPEYPDALNNIGTVYDKLGRFEEAVDAYSRAIKLKPNFGLAYNNLGAAYYSLGRDDDAIVAYKHALGLLPKESRAHNNLGMVYSKLGRYQEACESLRTAIQLSPADTQLHRNLAIVYCKMGRANEAADLLRKAIELNPNFAEAHNDLGTALHKLGRLKEAFESFRRAAQIKPDFAEALNNLGITSTHLGRNQEAIETLKQAIRVKPDFARAYNNLGLVYSKAGSHSEGIQYYKEAVGLSPDFAEARNNLGISYLALGDFQSALDTYGTLRSLNQKLASQLLSFLEKQYTVGLPRGTESSAHGFASTERSRSQAPTQDLINRIRNLGEKGALSRNIADTLIAELQITNHQPESDNAIVRINLLGYFIEKVRNLVNAQEIAEEEGQSLIDVANAIINGLSD